jgi:hypothetical protein
MRIASNRLAKMIAEATVDCYNDAEMATGLLVAIQEHLVLPFRAEVLGLAVQVTAVDITAAGAIVAVCKHGRLTQRVALVDLVLPEPAPIGAQWIAAYRRWAHG